MSHQILIGDCREQMRTLKPKSVHMACSSPPYFGLRDYLVDGQIGLEATPEQYVEAMVAVYAEVWRVLRDDGVCFVNLGDSYANDGKWGGHSGGKHDYKDGALIHQPIGRNKRYTGLKPKDLCGMPWRVAFALQDAGWYLRQDEIWTKPNPMPESTEDRCTKAHEYIFLLTKKPRYFWDKQGIATPGKGHAAGNKTHKYADAYEAGEEGEKHRTKAGLKALAGQEASTSNRRSVWQIAGDAEVLKWLDAHHPELCDQYISEQVLATTNWQISTQSFKGAHFATFPERIPELCIKAGTSERGCCPTCGKQWVRVTEKTRRPSRPGVDSKVYVDPAGSPYEQHSGTIIGNRDPQRHVTETVTIGWRQDCQCEAHEPVPAVVLDPFLGSGTTVQVATHLGRHGIGCELNPEYVALAEQRIATPPRFLTRKTKTGRRQRVPRTQKSLFSEN